MGRTKKLPVSMHCFKFPQYEATTMSNAERFYFFSYWSGKEVCGRRRADEKMCTTSPLPMQKGETFFQER